MKGLAFFIGMTANFAVGVVGLGLCIFGAPVPIQGVEALGSALIVLAVLSFTCMLYLEDKNT